MGQGPPPSHITIFYSTPDDYRIVPANGVYGGVSPKGEVVAHFFVDHNKFPDQGAYEQIEGSPPGNYRQVFPQSQGIQRAFQVGIMLSAAEARSIGKWLSERADEVLGPEGAPPNG